MQCTKCKIKIKSSRSYCPGCGAFLPLLLKKPAKINAKSNNFRISDYYGEQFYFIRKGYGSQFNIAAYMLFPIHLIYRKCMSRFLTVALPISLLWALSLLFAVFVPYYSYANMLFLTPLIICPVIYIVLSIYNGFTFNSYFYERHCGNAHIPTNKNGVAVYLCVLALYMAAVVFFYIVTRFAPFLVW